MESFAEDMDFLESQLETANSYRHIEDELQNDVVLMAEQREKQLAAQQAPNRRASYRSATSTPQPGMYGPK